MKAYENYLRYAPALMTEWQQLMDEGRPVESFRAECERIAAAEWTPELEREALALADELVGEVVGELSPEEVEL